MEGRRKLILTMKSISLGTRSTQRVMESIPAMGKHSFPFLFLPLELGLFQLVMPF